MSTPQPIITTVIVQTLPPVLGGDGSPPPMAVTHNARDSGSIKRFGLSDRCRDADAFSCSDRVSGALARYESQLEDPGRDIVEVSVFTVRPRSITPQGMTNVERSRYRDIA